MLDLCSLLESLIHRPSRIVLLVLIYRRRLEIPRANLLEEEHVELPVPETSDRLANGEAGARAGNSRLSLGFGEAVVAVDPAERRPSCPEEASFCLRTRGGEERGERKERERGEVSLGTQGRVDGTYLPVQSLLAEEVGHDNAVHHSNEVVGEASEDDGLGAKASRRDLGDNGVAAASKSASALH